jgi:hypothetical protein
MKTAKSAKITRVKALEDGSNGVAVFGKFKDGAPIELTVRNPHEAGRLMAFDYPEFWVDDDDQTLTFVDTNNYTKQIAGAAIAKRAGGSNGMMIFKSATQSGSPADENDVMAIAEKLIAELRNDPDFRSLPVETRVQVAATALKTAARALQARGAIGTDHSDDASLDPEAAQARGDAAGKQPGAAQASKMSKAERQMWREFGIDPDQALPPLEKAMSIGNDLGKLAQRVNAEAEGDISKVLTARLNQERPSVAGWSDSLLKSDGAFGGSIRKGVDTWRNERGETLGTPSGDDLISQLSSAVRKSHDSRALDFNAVFGGGGQRMHVNRMLADGGFDGEQKAELVGKLADRGRIGVDGIHKLLH